MWLPFYAPLESYIQVGLLKFGPFNLTPGELVGHSVFLRHLYAQEDDFEETMLYCDTCGAFTAYTIEVVSGHYFGSCKQCQHIRWAKYIPGALHSCYYCGKQTPLFHNYCDQCGAVAPHGYDRAPMMDETDCYEPWYGEEPPEYWDEEPLEVITLACTEGMTVAEIQSLSF